MSKGCGCGCGFSIRHGGRPFGFAASGAVTWVVPSRRRTRRQDLRAMCVGRPPGGSDRHSATGATGSLPRRRRPPARGRLQRPARRSDPGSRRPVSSWSGTLLVLHELEDAVDRLALQDAGRRCCSASPSFSIRARTRRGRLVGPGGDGLDLLLEVGVLDLQISSASAILERRKNSLRLRQGRLVGIGPDFGLTRPDLGVGGGRPGFISPTWRRSVESLLPGDEVRRQLEARSTSGAGRGSRGGSACRCWILDPALQDALQARRCGGRRWVSKPMPRRNASSTTGRRSCLRSLTWKVTRMAWPRRAGSGEAEPIWASALAILAPR